jgi:hypothetical protein
VSDAEAEFFKGVERKAGSSSKVNAIMGGVRGLQRIPEVDDCLLRMMKNAYEEYFKGEIGVFMMTIVHEWGRDSSEVREEQILVICLLDGNLKDADMLGKMYPPFARGESATEQFLGSIRTQLFLKLESVANRPFRSAPGAWSAEVSGVLFGADMKEVLEAMTDDQAARLVAVLRKPLDKNKQAKWTLLLSSKGGPQEGTYLGGLSYKEATMGSPTRRAINTIRERTVARQSRDSLRDRQTSRSRSNSKDSTVLPPRPRELNTNLIPGDMTRTPVAYDMRPTYYKESAPSLRAVPRSLLLSPGMRAGVLPGATGGHSGGGEEAETTGK